MSPAHAQVQLTPRWLALTPRSSTFLGHSIAPATPPTPLMVRMGAASTCLPPYNLQLIVPVAATKRAGTKSVVIVSVSTVGRDDVFGRQFAEIEGKARAADIPFTALRLPFFLDNIWGNAASIKGQSKIYNSIAPEAA